MKEFKVVLKVNSNYEGEHFITYALRAPSFAAAVVSAIKRSEAGGYQVIEELNDQYDQFGFEVGFQS